MDKPPAYSVTPTNHNIQYNNSKRLADPSWEDKKSKRSKSNTQVEFHTTGGIWNIIFEYPPCRSRHMYDITEIKKCFSNTALVQMEAADDVWTLIWEFVNW
eukprot:UN03338